MVLCPLCKPLLVVLNDFDHPLILVLWVMQGCSVCEEVMLSINAVNINVGLRLHTSGQTQSSATGTPVVTRTPALLLEELVSNGE